MFNNLKKIFIVDQYLIRLISVFTVILLLTACDGGNSDNDNDVLVIEPVVVSVKASIEELVIDLNDTATSSFSITTTFDDNSEKTYKLTAFWDSENKLLSIVDEDENSLSIKYDANKIDEESILLTIDDELFAKNIEFNISVTPKTDPIIDPAEILKIIYNNSVTTLSVGDTLNLSFDAEKSDSEIQDDILSLVKCSSVSELVMVTENCKFRALSAGIANVKVELKSNAAVQLNIEFRILPIQIKQIFFETVAVSIERGQKGQLVLKGINTDNSNVTIDLFEIVTCYSDSLLIDVSTGCEVAAKNIGSATVKLKMIDLSIEPPQLSTSSVTITIPPIKTLSLLSDGLSLDVNANKQLTLTVEYVDGILTTDDYNVAECFIAAEYSDIVKVTPTCNVTALKSGSASVSVKLKSSQNISFAVEPLTINVRPEISTEPLIKTLSLTSDGNPLDVNESKQLTLTVEYTDGVLAADDYGVAECFVAAEYADIIEATPTCNVTALKFGSGIVSIKLKSPQNIPLTVEALTITVRPEIVIVSQLSVLPDIATIDVDEIISLTLSAKYSDGNILANALTIAECINVSDDTAVIDVMPDCTVQGLKSGAAKVSAVLKTAQDSSPTVIELRFYVIPPGDLITQLDISVKSPDSTTVNSGEIIQLQVLASWTITPVQTDVTALVNCKTENINQSDLIDINNCQLAALDPGTYPITAEMKDPTQALPNLIVNTIDVVISANDLGDVNNNGGVFDIVIPAGVSRSVFKLTGATGIHKLSLADGGSNATLILRVMPQAEFSQFVNFCVNSIASNRDRVSCGIDMTTQNGEIFVFIEDVGLQGLNSSLTVTTDNDVLLNDALGTLTVVDNFTMLTSGVAFNGHVSVNLEGDNESGYRLASAELAKPEGSPVELIIDSYQLTITVIPDIDGLININQLNAINTIDIGWNDNAGDPAFQFCTSTNAGINCSCQIMTTIITGDTISCEIPQLNGQGDIFITVFGNGYNATVPTNGPASAAGELSYRILFDRNYLQ